MRLIHKKLIALVFVALILFPLFGVGVGGNAYADTALSGYSDVLNDLQKDDSFNPDEYPAIDGDYSLQVIQIAESTAGELFVYVYQPAANEKPLTATQINMSLTDDFAPYDYEDNVTETPDDNQDGGEVGGGHGGGGVGGRSAASSYLYDLTLLNRNGVFAKYKVASFAINGSMVRYYNITSIYRLFDVDIDEPTGGSDTIEEVAFPVGKFFTVETAVNGKIIYNCEKRKVVEVLKPFFAHIRYTDDNGWTKKSCDSHFVAFSTDWQIDELYLAELEYTARSAEAFGKNDQTTGVSFGDPELKHVILTDDDRFSVSDDFFWLFTHTLERCRIETVEKFISEESDKLSSSDTKRLKDLTWVLRFAETDYKITKNLLTGYFSEDYTYISDVAILRLKFKSQGTVYDLGAVADIGTGSVKPINKEKSLWEIFIDFCKFLESVTGLNYVVWAIILLAIPLGAVFGILSILIPPVRFVLGKIFKGIGYFFYYLGYGLFWLVSRPFVGIKALIDKLRGN